MATQPFETRLSAVEQVLLDLAPSHARTEAGLDRTRAHLDEFAAETRAALQRLDRTEANLDRTEANLDRTRAHLDEFAAETRAALRRMEEMGARSDRRWGELANKMGTLTEDIVIPGIPAVFRTFFAEEGPVEMAVRVRRRHRLDPGRTEEYDAVTSGGDVVLVAESKSTLRPEHLGEFGDKLARSRDFLPEAAAKRVVGLLASFYLEPSPVVAGERQGLIMVGLGTGLLQVLNAPGFVPRAF